MASNSCVTTSKRVEAKTYKRNLHDEQKITDRNKSKNEHMKYKSKYFHFYKDHGHKTKNYL